MKTAVYVVTSLALGGLLTGYGITERSEDEAAVRQAVQYYMDGQEAGDGDTVAKAFHPDARLTHMRDGAVRIIPIEEYLGWFRGEPAGDEAERERRIESVDITGDAAVAKVVLDYPGRTFTDYMSLLRVDGEWKIIHKNFTMAAK